MKPAIAKSMKTTKWTYVFFLLGLIFASFAIYFCFQPSQVWAKGDSEYYTRVKLYRNKGYSTLAMAIIASSCFIVVGRLIRKGHSVTT